MALAQAGRPSLRPWQGIEQLESNTMAKVNLMVSRWLSYYALCNRQYRIMSWNLTIKCHSLENSCVFVVIISTENDIS